MIQIIPTEDGKVMLEPSRRGEAVLLALHGPRGGYLGHVTLRGATGECMLGALEKAEREAAEIAESLVPPPDRSAAEEEWMGHS